VSYTFRKPARPVSRVFVHCSASDRPEHDSAAVIDRWHREKGWAGIGYHFFIRKDGTLETGRDLEKIPAAQEGNNTGTIAICLHGLDIDKFTEAQFSTLRGLCLDIDEAYRGTVTFHGHREVARKECPVFDYKAVLRLDARGGLGDLAGAADMIRQDLPPALSDLEVLPNRITTLRLGDRGDLVRGLQVMLESIGYFPGALDSIFGARTRAAVLAFQADNHLVADGIVGPLTREVLGASKPREVAPARALATLADLSAGGSRIAQASLVNTRIGALIAGGGAITAFDQMTGVISQVTGQSQAIQQLFDDHGLAAGLVILAAGAFVAWQSWRAGQARVEDHRTGKTS
jgi:peptidoglycan hydrolase-like protein with peptidoglycan-binding domain